MYITKEQYDREMTALKAEIDTLKAIVSILQKSSIRSILQKSSIRKH